MDYKQRAESLFLKDRYAIETTGVVVEEVGENYCKCRLDIKDKHLNANDCVMGGAIFTLTDYAFGVAANTPVSNSVTLSSNISFTRPAKGPTLFAEAKCIKNGRTICFFQIEVTDSEGRTIATAQTSGFRSNM